MLFLLHVDAPAYLEQMVTWYGPLQGAVTRMALHIVHMAGILLLRPKAGLTQCPPGVYIHSMP